MFIVPGYCPLRILERFDNTGRKLELIAKKIENFLSVSKIAKNNCKVIVTVCKMRVQLVSRDTTEQPGPTRVQSHRPLVEVLPTHR